MSVTAPATTNVLITPDRQISPGMSGPQRAAAEGRNAWGEDGFSFGDLLDFINPLQHIPGVSTLYRAATGDEIAAPARVLGGALLAGPVGLIAAVVGSVVEQETGSDVGKNILTLFSAEEKTRNDVNAGLAAVSAGKITDEEESDDITRYVKSETSVIDSDINSGKSDGGKNYNSDPEMAALWKPPAPQEKPPQPVRQPRRLPPDHLPELSRKTETTKIASTHAGPLRNMPEQAAAMEKLGLLSYSIDEALRHYRRIQNIDITDNK